MAPVTTTLQECEGGSSEAPNPPWLWACILAQHALTQLLHYKGFDRETWRKRSITNMENLGNLPHRYVSFAMSEHFPLNFPYISLQLGAPYTEPADCIQGTIYRSWDMLGTVAAVLSLLQYFVHISLAAETS